jgi:hypothetical protein
MPRKKPVASQGRARILTKRSGIVRGEKLLIAHHDVVIEPEVDVFNEGDRKPVSIGERIGRRPIFAAGNVGSGGDVAMLRWSQSSDRPNLQVLVLHDDAEREMAYGEPTNASLTAAERYGWQVVRMASDWKIVFARPLAKKAEPAKPDA